MWLKQSTAVTIKFGPFVDATDGVTAETGLTISQADIRLSKNGGNIAQSNNAAGATHDELGYYDVPLDTTDTNTLGTLRVAVSESGALPVWQDFMVVPANVWDSLFSTDKLQVDTVEISGTTQTANDVGADVNEILTDTGTTLQGEVDGIQADTEDIQTRLPAALTAGGNIKADVLAISGDTTSADNLEAATDGNTYNVGGGAVVAASVTGAVGGNVTGSVGSLAAQAKADVNAEVLDVLNVDTFAEPGQGTPTATTTLVAKIGYLFKNWRNKKEQTATEWSLYNDDTTTKGQKATVSDDGTTATKGEIATGA